MGFDRRVANCCSFLAFVSEVFSCSQGLVAGILCEFKLEDGWIPVNKNLW
jgi:hypothetical protein